MPQLSESMTEATVVAWLKEEGDPVAVGDGLCEVETEKSNVDLSAEHSGILERILVPAGTDGVKVGTVLAEIETGARSELGRPGREDNGEGLARAHAASAVHASGDSHSQGQKAAPAGAAERVAVQPPPVSATPLARCIAARAGLELSSIRGSGPRGRIVKADVDAALASVQELPASPATAAEPFNTHSDGAGETKRGKATATGAELAARSPVRTPIVLSRARQVAARRLATAKRTVPHFYLEVECRVDRLLSLRDEVAQARSGLHVRVTDCVVRAMGLALREVPEANVAWLDDRLYALGEVDVAVAVACEDGLLTPVVRRADAKGLVELSAEIASLARRARDGALAPADYDGGSTTVSNLGMYDVDGLYPILNPPQASILGVGTVRERPIVAGEEIVVARMLTLTLSADHRALDGVVGSRLLTRVRRHLENPVSLLFAG